MEMDHTRLTPLIKNLMAIIRQWPQIMNKRQNILCDKLLYGLQNLVLGAKIAKITKLPTKLGPPMSLDNFS
jgi:hypothetical protein